MNKERLHRMAYTGVGYAAHYLDEMRVKPPITSNSSNQEGPHILFTFWDAPGYRKSRELMEELQGKFGGSGLPIGIGLFVRPWANVLSRSIDYVYDRNHNTGFKEAAAETKTPVLFIAAGMQWNEVTYPKSPLLQKLEERDENLMRYADGTRVQRVFQPPSDKLPSALRGLFGTDKNGVVYLDYNAPEVEHYREKNLRLVAKDIQDFARNYPGLYLGACVENEVDFPGTWVTGDRELEVGSQEDRIEIVREVLETNVRIFKEAGLTNIYTNQSIEDAENRGSPLSTAFIEGANVGITTWKTGNISTFNQAAELAKQHGVNWALPITNPLSFTEHANLVELTNAKLFNPKFIGFYNWWPHFPGYGVRGMVLEKVIKALTK